MRRTLAALVFFGCALHAQDAPKMRLEGHAVSMFNQSLYFGAFQRPRALAYDPKHDEVWLADSGTRRIGIHTPEGMELFSFASREHLQDPVLIAIAPGGRIAVVEGNRTTVRLFNYRGLYQRDVALKGLPAKASIGGITYDSSGQLYVADNKTSQVFVYRPDGTLKFQFGSHGAEEGQFTSICAVTVGKDGTIYVLDQRAIAVQLFDSEGNFIRGWGKHEMGAQNFSLPSGIALDSKGRVIVTDELRQQIKVFSAEGVLLTSFGGLGENLGELAYPADVTVDKRDRIFVCERLTARVQIFELREVPAE